MILTHLALYSFLDGASGVSALGQMGGSLSLPPYYLFDGFSEAGAQPEPTPAADQIKGGLPAKRRRRLRRVYIKLDERTVWFKNEDNALEFLRAHAKKVEARISAEVERKSRVLVAPRELVGPDTSPIRLPVLTVRGSEDAQQIALDLNRRMRAILRLLDAQAYADLLDEEDEVMLLQ